MFTIEIPLADLILIIQDLFLSLTTRKKEKPKVEYKSKGFRQDKYKSNRLILEFEEIKQKEDNKIKPKGRRLGTGRPERPSIGKRCILFFSWLKSLFNR